MEGEWGWDEYQFNPAQDEPAVCGLDGKGCVA
jgi:hypothetical protein